MRNDKKQLALAGVLCLLAGLTTTAIAAEPTRPYTINTVDEHLDMLMVCHHLDPSIPEDIAFRRNYRIKDMVEHGFEKDLMQDLGLG